MITWYSESLWQSNWQDLNARAICIVEGIFLCTRKEKYQIRPRIWSTTLTVLSLEFYLWDRLQQLESFPARALHTLAVDSDIDCLFHAMFSIKLCHHSIKFDNPSMCIIMEGKAILTRSKAFILTSCWIPQPLIEWKEKIPIFLWTSEKLHDIPSFQLSNFPSSRFSLVVLKKTATIEKGRSH